jgi:prevent-host-death family protein
MHAYHLTSQTRPVTIRSMTETYSTYDAKAKLSEILRKVESGRTIRISRRGEPIAEIRPLRSGPSRLADRIEELTDAGALTRPAAPAAALRPVAVRAGALDRFLADRDA